MYLKQRHRIVRKLIFTVIRTFHNHNQRLFWFTFKKYVKNQFENYRFDDSLIQCINLTILFIFQINIYSNIVQ